MSTTHVLSSGIAGTMVANGSDIQRATVRNIILAGVLTLPICVILGAALFGAGLFLVLWCTACISRRGDSFSVDLQAE